ncbi:MAG: alpha/beta hydrolase [Rubrobacteraceae bacterium]
MSVVIILVIAVIFVVVAASLMLGRTTHEVESVSDMEFVEIEGRWIRYNVIGGGPPVVLVHGWLLSSRIWDQIARRLAQRFTVYTLDLTGFGESDKPVSGYGVRYGSRLLYAFCAHFGISRAGVIAHDLGGNMAVKLAADHPDLVGRLVLVSVPADENQIDLPTMLWLTTVPVVGPLFFMLGRLLRPLRKLWMRHFVADPADLPEEAVEDPAQSTPAAAGKTLTVTRTEISGSRLLRQAGIIKVPVLLVAGERDLIVDPHSVSDWGQSISQAEIALLNDCGHLPMVERPDELGARILAFLTGDDRYLDYAREVPAPVPEPPAEQEARAPDERPGEDPAEPLEEPAGKPGKPTTPGDLRWEFDVGDKARPRKASRPPSPSQAREEPAPGEDVGKEPLQKENVSNENVSNENVSDEGDRKPFNFPTRGEDEGQESKSQENFPEEDRPGYGNRSRPPEEKDRPRPSREDSGSGRIPEFPGDLFQWSDKPRPRVRRTSRNRPEEPDDSSAGGSS